MPKKYLPLILLAVGLLLVGGVFFFMNNRKVSDLPRNEEGLMEVPFEKRPAVSLIPKEDGHYLKLRVERFEVAEFDSMDYLLLYNTKDEVTQGVPGSEKVKGTDIFEADLLLGSESSGNFRYDEGVETGSIEISFRDSDGELVAKFDSDFHMQKGTDDELTSVDGSFSKSFGDLPDDVNFVTMELIGDLKNHKAFHKEGDYVVFSSDPNITSEDL